MGRIKEEIRVDGLKCWTLFDISARNTYITPEVARHLTVSRLKGPVRAALGGKVRRIRQTAILEGKLQGRWFSTHARIVHKIGNDEDGRPIEILFGALAMQEWGVRPIPEEERLDLSHFTKEFIEF